MTPQHQVRVRLTLPPDLHGKLVALPPAVRGQAVSTVLTSVIHGIDLPRVIVCNEQLRRLGVLLNQSLHVAHQGRAFDTKRVTDVLDFIETLRAPYRRGR